MKAKAEITTEQTLKLILAIAVVVLLSFLLWRLISPSFNKDKETAKSYFETLDLELAKADSGETGEFLIWQGENIFLVYFGDKMYAPYKEIDKPNNSKYKHLFFAGVHDANYLCMCYDIEGYETYSNVEYRKTQCEFCRTLEGPAKYQDIGPWVLKAGEKISINKEKGVYVFKQV